MFEELRQHFSNHPELNNVLLIGLGGGSLCSYLNAKFPELHIDAVDIDSAVIEIAQRYFGLKTGPNLKVHCADGLKYIQDLAISGIWFNSFLLTILLLNLRFRSFQILNNFRPQIWLHYPGRRLQRYNYRFG